MAQQPHNRSTQKVCMAYSLNRVNGAYDIVNEGSRVNTQDVLQIVSSKTPYWRTLKRWQRPENYYRKASTVLADDLKYSISWTGSAMDRLSSWDRVCWMEPSIVIDAHAKADDPLPMVTAMVLAELNQSKASTLVSIAEINKTAGSIGNAARTIAEAIRSLLARDLRGAARALGETATGSQVRGFNRAIASAGVTPGRERTAALNDAITKTWLNYSYAWKPLLNDVYNQMEALAQQNTERSDIVRVIKKRFHYDAEVFKVIDPDGVAFFQSSHSTNNRSIKMVVRYSIPTGDVPALVTFGINNPLEVAWELVPFSFVADWFLPVGAFLKSISATSGCRFHTGSYTRLEKTMVDVKIASKGKKVHLGGDNYMQLVDTAGNYHREEFAVTRVPLMEFPEPPLPKLRDPRSVVHAASAIALLYQLTR